MKQQPQKGTGGRERGLMGKVTGNATVCATVTKPWRKMARSIVRREGRGKKEREGERTRVMDHETFVWKFLAPRWNTTPLPVVVIFLPATGNGSGTCLPSLSLSFSLSSPDFDRSIDRYPSSPGRSVQR